MNHSQFTREPTHKTHRDSALFVTGSEDSDAITISAGTAAGQLAVNVNGVVAGTQFNPTGRVYVYGRGGHDHISVSATAPLGTVIDGEEDSDTVTIAFGGLAGQVTVADTGFGEFDADSLLVEGTLQDDYVVKTPALVTWGNPVSESIGYAGIEMTIVNAGDGNDTIDDPGSATVLLGGVGDDTYIITATSGNGVAIEDQQGATEVTAYLAELAGPLTIDVEGSADPITVQVIGTDQPDQIELTDSALLGRGRADQLRRLGDIARRGRRRWR